MSAVFKADDIFPKCTMMVISAHVTEGKWLVVSMSNGKEYKYPQQWLRHKCPCSLCFDSSSQSYQNLLGPLVFADFRIKSVSLKDTAVVCVWSDDHTSTYSATWLYNRRLTEGGNKQRQDNIFELGRPIAWPSSADMSIQTATYDEVTETMEGFKKFAEYLIRDGIFVMKGAPDKFVYNEFAQKTGITIFNTHYGENFVVENVPNATNLAYTSGKIDLHVDLPCLDYCPKIQFLHCLTPAEVGGENVISDGMKAANILRQRYHEHFKTLTETMVQFEDVISIPDQPHYYITRSSPVIVLDKLGEPLHIQWGQFPHSSYFNGNPEECDQWYTAMKAFYHILTECSTSLKANAGDILVFDNLRVMHSREAYRSTEARKLEGWYSNWDMIFSRLRVAKIQTMEQQNSENMH